VALVSTLKQFPHYARITWSSILLLLIPVLLLFYFIFDNGGFFYLTSHKRFHDQSIHCIFFTSLICVDFLNFALVKCHSTHQGRIIVAASGVEFLFV
jgi:hypothetical protein